VSQLVQAALTTQFALPIRAICGTAGHCSQKLRIDFDDFLHMLRTNIAAHCRTRVHCNNDTALVERKSQFSLFVLFLPFFSHFEHKSQGRGSVSHLDGRRSFRTFKSFSDKRANLWGKQKKSWAKKKFFLSNTKPHTFATLGKTKFDGWPLLCFRNKNLLKKKKKNEER
jgi:hypothetical protein